MASSLKLIFADCYQCGAYGTWYESQQAVAVANEFEIETMPFYVDGAAEYIRLAIQQGVNMPFFTDGVKCSKNVEDFVVVETKKKTSRKRVKKVEEADES